MVVVNTLGEGVHELSKRDGTSKVSAQTTNNSVAVKLTSCNNEVTPFKIICWQHHWGSVIYGRWHGAVVVGKGAVADRKLGRQKVFYRHPKSKLSDFN